MNIEEQVLSWLVLSGDYASFSRTGVTKDYFLHPDSRSVFTWVWDFHENYNEAPTPDAVLLRFPDFPFTEDLAGPIEFLVDQMRESRRRLIVEMGISTADAALGKDDLNAALAALNTTVTAAAASVGANGDIDAVDTFDLRMERYRQACSTDGMLGIPTGFKFLDAATQGLQPSQFIVITGLAKSCKTTIELAVARAVHDAKKVGLIVSFEMSEPEVTRRLDGFWAGVNPRRLQSGDMTEAEWRRMDRASKRLAGSRPLIVTEDRASTMTISGIRAKVEQVKPDVLFVDGAYFLMDEVSRESQTPIALTNISRGLKRMAMACNIAVVITTQALPHKVGTRGMTMYSAGYTSAWAQDADVLMGTEADPVNPGRYKTPILASRNSLPGDYEIEISWEPPEIKEIDCEDADGRAGF